MAYLTVFYKIIMFLKNLLWIIANKYRICIILVAVLELEANTNAIFFDLPINWSN